MDDPALTACFEACSGMSRRASRLLADHQDCMHRSREQLALSRKLLAMRVYPNDGVPPHNPFDYNGFKTTEQSE
jgi:hypothetical protein